MIRVPSDKIVTRTTAEPEDQTPEQAEGKSSPGYAASVRTMMKGKSVWNWCQAIVYARFKGSKVFQGERALGNCSYKNREDFIENSGYYNDMVKDAVDDLHRQVYDRVADLMTTGIFDDNVQIANDLMFLADGQDDDLGKLMVRAAKALRFQRTDE